MAKLTIDHEREVQQLLFTTRNKRLSRAIDALQDIHDGECDGHNVVTQLKRIAHNLICLRTLLIKNMNS